MPGEALGTKEYRKRKEVYCSLTGLYPFHCFEAMFFKFTGVQERDFSGDTTAVKCLCIEMPYVTSAGLLAMPSHVPQLKGTLENIGSHG